jgi:hypothetical protein
MTLHPGSVPDYNRVVTEAALHCDAKMTREPVMIAALQAKVAELERLVAWLRRAEFKNLYKPHPSSPVFIMAEEVGQHLASSPPEGWKP